MLRLIAIVAILLQMCTLIHSRREGNHQSFQTDENLMFSMCQLRLCQRNTTTPVSHVGTFFKISNLLTNLMCLIFSAESPFQHASNTFYHCLNTENVHLVLMKNGQMKPFA